MTWKVAIERMLLANQRNIMSLYVYWNFMFNWIEKNVLGVSVACVYGVCVCGGGGGQT